MDVVVLNANYNNITSFINVGILNYVSLLILKLEAYHNFHADQPCLVSVMVSRCFYAESCHGCYCTCGVGGNGPHLSSGLGRVA